MWYPPAGTKMHARYSSRHWLFKIVHTADGFWGMRCMSLGPWKRLNHSMKLSYRMTRRLKLSVFTSTANWPQSTVKLVRDNRDFSIARLCEVHYSHRGTASFAFYLTVSMTHDIQHICTVTPPIAESPAFALMKNVCKHGHVILDSKHAHVVVPHNRAVQLAKTNGDIVSY